MTEDNACEASSSSRYDEVRRNAPAFRTSVGNIVYANTVSVYDANFSDIKRCVLVIIEHAPQFIDRLVLRQCCLASRSH